MNIRNIIVGTAKAGAIVGLVAAISLVFLAAATGLSTWTCGIKNEMFCGDDRTPCEVWEDTRRMLPDRDRTAWPKDVAERMDGMERACWEYAAEGGGR